MIRFTVPGQPLPAERPQRVSRKGGKGFVWITPDKTLDAEARVAAAFRQQVPGHVTDTTCAWAIQARFYRETLVTADLDNMLKVVLDGLQGVLLANDSQVADLHGIRHLGAGKGQGMTVVTARPIGSLKDSHRATGHPDTLGTPLPLNGG